MSWDQLLLALLSVAAIALTQMPERFHCWAPVVGLASQPFWLYSTYTAGVWGIFALSILYTAIWLWGCWIHWITPHFGKNVEK